MKSGYCDLCGIRVRNQTYVATRPVPSDHSIYAPGRVFNMLDVNKLPALKAAAGAFCKKVTCTESKWNEPFFKTRRGVNLVLFSLKKPRGTRPEIGCFTIHRQGYLYWVFYLIMLSESLSLNPVMFCRLRILGSLKRNLASHCLLVDIFLETPYLVMITILSTFRVVKWQFYI